LLLKEHVLIEVLLIYQYFFGNEENNKGGKTESKDLTIDIMQSGYVVWAKVR